MVGQDTARFCFLRLLPMRARLCGVLATMLILAIAMPVRAGDLDSAKNSLEKVKSDVDNSSWSSIDDDIKATESFLDGLPDADRAPVQKQLDDLKAKAAAGIKDYKSKLVLDPSKRELDNAADSLAADPNGAKDMIDRATALLNSDDAKKYADPDQVAKLQARAQSLTAMVVTKHIEGLAPLVKEYDDAMAANPFKDAKTDQDVTQVQQTLDSYKSRINGALSSLPADDQRVVAIKQKLDGYDKTIAAAVGAAGATQEAANLAHQWESTKEYFAGWDQEKDVPSWHDWTHNNTEAIGNLDLTKTLEAVVRVGPWLQEDYVKKTAADYKDNASVKATIAEAQQTYDTASAKMNTNFNKLLDEAEAIASATHSDREGIEHLHQRVDYFFNNSKYHDANEARSKALMDKWANAVAGAAAAKEATLKKMTDDANAAWPGIAASITATEGFTPDKLDQFKGKIIHLNKNNRLGWDFMPGEYIFACNVNGMAVAGKFDSAVRAAVDSARNLIPPDQFPDEGWDLYATVEGPGKIEGRTHVEGDVKVDGEKVGTVTSEQHPTLDCAVIKIFALHVGPVAVGSNGLGGAVIGAPAGVAADGSGSTGASTSFFGRLLGWIFGLIQLAIGVAVAGLVVLKVRPALVAQTTGDATVKLPDNELIGVIGLVVTALGVLWLIFTLIIKDLLPAGSFTLCGVLLAADWLTAKKILPANLAATLKSFAIPIAGCTVVFIFLHLFLGNHWLF